MSASAGRPATRDAVDAAFARARIAWCGCEVVNNRVHVGALETRGAIGEYDAAGGRYTLHTGSQMPHELKHALAEHVLHVAPERRPGAASPMSAAVSASRTGCIPSRRWCCGRRGGIGRPVALDRRARGRFPVRLPGARQCHDRRAGARRGGQLPRPAGAHAGGDRRLSGARRAALADAPTRRRWPGSIGCRASMSPSTACSPIPRRPRSIAAPAGRRRSICVERLVDHAARESGIDRWRCAAATC